MPGLLIGGLIGSPGIATVLVSAGLLITWSRGPAPVAGTIVAIVLGVTTCFLLSRAGTAAFASFLSTRRFRDLAFVGLAMFGLVIGLGANLLGGVAAAGPEAWRGFLAAAATVLGWTPFGWAWALPAALARGEWLSAGLHLVLAVALVAVLWRAWEYFLAARLTEPLDRGGEGGHVKADSLAGRLYPATPAGGVALRTLRYWRRDPRYLAGIFGYAIAPVILIVIPIINPDSERLFSPCSRPCCWAGCWAWASRGISATTERPSGCTPPPGSAAPTTALVG